MSVYYQNALIYGFKMDPDDIIELEDEDRDLFSDIIDEKYKLKKENVGSVSIIIDAMNAEFAYVGILQACSDSTQNGRATFNNKGIEFPNTKQLENLNDVIEKFDLFNYIENENPKQYIFTMYH